MQRFRLGDRVWAIGPDGRPCEAMVVSTKSAELKIKLRLLDWGADYDEWFDNDPFPEDGSPPEAVVTPGARQFVHGQGTLASVHAAGGGWVVNPPRDRAGLAPSNGVSGVDGAGGKAAVRAGAPMATSAAGTARYGGVGVGGVGGGVGGGGGAHLVYYGSMASAVGGDALAASLAGWRNAGARLGALPDALLKHVLVRLHLRRDQLKQALAHRDPSVTPEAFLVRLNLASRHVQYVGAQIVRASSEDDVQVRGIELAGGRLFADSAPQVADAKLCAVQGTKLQYVSNRPFTDAELVDLCAKIRSGILEDLPFADVHERIEAMHASLQNVQNVPPRAAAAAAAARRRRRWRSSLRRRRRTRRRRTRRRRPKRRRRARHEGAAACS